MKLITEIGLLDLPEGFSLMMERTNPLLSDQGDSTIPATLPSSPHNLATLEHRERIDRAERYINKVDAILQVGPVQKRGKLVIDTEHRLEGIDASLAIDSSDLYVKAKDKTLKQIFEEADSEGVSKMTFGSVEAAMDIMQDCYEGDDTKDFTIFPVAIAPYEQEIQGVKNKIYQYNNEVDYLNQLVWAARTTHEGDVIMYVPEGYGIAPFLKLHRLLHRLFECLGYTVTENCFDDTTGDNILANLVIVHNCSDALVRPILLYSDLVPSCTLSDFLSWLLAKFHAQPVVNSETKTAKIVLMEDMLSSTPDMDLSDKVEGDFKVQLNPSKRIVLTPTNSLEGTTPAADSFDKLVEKYGGYVEANEDQWVDQTYNDCLVLRKATGQFYALTRDLSTGNQVKEPLGSNHFVYDRANSDDTEAFSQSDVMPLMLCGLVKPMQTRDVVPFIGERLHFHTSYNGNKEDDKQEIILCQKAFSANFHYLTTGTTQDYIPHKTNSGTDLALNLTNYGLYDRFWKNYNELILNYPVRLTGRVLYDLGTFLGMDMSRPKFFAGQNLMPVSASAPLNDRFGLTDVEMILVKKYVDGIADTPITPSAGTGLKWVLKFSGGSPHVIEDLWDNTVVDFENTHPTYAVAYDEMTDSSITISGSSGSQYLGLPLYEGQTIDIGNHDVVVTVNGFVIYKDTSLPQSGEQRAFLTDSQTLFNCHCIFVAERA